MLSFHTELKFPPSLQELKGVSSLSLFSLCSLWLVAALAPPELGQREGKQRKSRVYVCCQGWYSLPTLSPWRLLRWWPLLCCALAASPLETVLSRGLWKGRSPLCLPSSGAGGFSSCSLPFSLQQSQAASHLQTFLDTNQTCNSRVHGSSPPKRSPSPSLSIWRWQKRHYNTAVLHLADSSLRRTLHPSEHTPKFPCFSRINERTLV